MKDIKIAFFDIDGTLTNSKQELTENVINSLRYLKNKGIILVLTSGRWDSYILNYNKDNLFDYIIANNGAEIYDINSNKVLYEEFMDKIDINIIDSYCNENNIEMINNTYFNRSNNIIDNIYQSVIICKSIQEVDDLKQYVNELNNTYISYISFAYYKKIKKNSYTININNKITNKGKSVKYMLDYLNIDKENSICFGDNINDLDMFNNVGIKVCMDNGSNKLKELSDYITLSNDEDGVAYFINNYIKNRED